MRPRGKKRSRERNERRAEFRACLPPSGYTCLRRFREQDAAAPRLPRGMHRGSKDAREHGSAARMKGFGGTSIARRYFRILYRTYLKNIREVSCFMQIDLALVEIFSSF